MLIKAADDKQRDIDTLESLLTRPGLDAGAHRRIETELRRVQAGIAESVAPPMRSSSTMATIRTA
jgi:hypothetical protein